MLHLLVASAVLSVALASKCCSPDQWQGSIGEIFGTVFNGQTHITTGNISMSYDYTNKLLATTSDLTVDDKPQRVTAIFNYQKKVVYTIMGGSCTTSHFTGNMLQLCVPDNAISTGKFTYGIGSDTLTAMSYMIPGDNNTHVFMTTTPGNPCVPISDVLYGTPQKVPSIQTLGFYDITPGISDPSVFTPPSICNGQKMLKPAPLLNSKVMNYIHSRIIKN